MAHHSSHRRSIAVLTMLTGVAALVGCSSDDEPASEAAASPTTAPMETSPTVPTTDVPTTDAPSPATTADSAVEEWSMDAEGPGTFRTALMEPGFTLTYGVDWVPFQPESRNQLNIEIPESTELGCAPCAFLTLNAVEADAPGDVIEFAESNGIQFADAESIDVGGIEAQRYEATGGAGYVFETEFAEFGLDTAEGPARVTVLEVNGRVIAIVDLAMPDVADDVQSLSDEVVASIEWENA